MKIKDNNKTKISFMLGFCLIMGLILRLWAIDFGLPFLSHVDEEHYLLKCQRLFRPQFSKVKTSFVFEIRQESDTLTPNVDVSDDTLV